MEKAIREEYALKIRELEDKKERMIKEAQLKLVPYETSVVLKNYDADRGGFYAEVEGHLVFIPVERSLARVIAQYRDKSPESLIVKGNLRFVDMEKGVFGLMKQKLGSNFRAIREDMAMKMALACALLWNFYALVAWFYFFALSVSFRKVVDRRTMRFLEHPHMEKCELVNAFLTVKGTDIMVPFGIRTDAKQKQK